LRHRIATVRSHSSRALPELNPPAERALDPQQPSVPHKRSALGRTAASREPMTTRLQHSYTAIGILRLERDLPVELIGVALMDSAADFDENSSVAIDIAQSLIEIETIVMVIDELKALATAKSLINQICEQANLPFNFVEHRELRPSEWHLTDNAALPPLLAPA